MDKKHFNTYIQEQREIQNCTIFWGSGKLWYHLFGQQKHWYHLLAPQPSLMWIKEFYKQFNQSPRYQSHIRTQIFKWKTLSS